MIDSTKFLADWARTRTGTEVPTLQRAFLDTLFFTLGRPPHAASLHDHYLATAYTVRDRLLDRWVRTAATYKNSNARTVCYLSAEYLLGPHLANNLNNLGIVENARQAAEKLDLDIGAIIDEEEEPGLGNGGLGRLAACYIDSMATLEIPSIAYGIRYEFGIFDQEIHDGWQREVSDMWLRNGNPWELVRYKLRFPVKFGGHTEHYVDEQGADRVRWQPDTEVIGVAYDTPILGYQVENANLLRLWKSEAAQDFNFEAFNVGDYYGAVNAKIVAETISKVLYPNDEPAAGKELRLRQQYFFVSCSLQDMIRIHLGSGASLDSFHEKYVCQLNDTHPSIAVAELMRLLIDEYEILWERAWNITRATFAYTNHTLLPEALETWSVELFERLLPRHLEIIYQINQRFLDEVRAQFAYDDERIARMSLIDESNGRRVRMAHLATVGSFAVNGVAAMHSELVKTTILSDFYDLWPQKFHNVTNGVTPRRFVQLANSALADLFTREIGDNWPRQMSQLRQVAELSEDPAFCDEWLEVKLEAKRKLSNIIRGQTGIAVDPHSLFDVQAKRIHEYKRQHLNVLHILTLYHRLKNNVPTDTVPRSFIFGGKAAPGYYMAKLIIKLINSVAELINNDMAVNEQLRVAFLPDFNVKNAQPLYPAADLSEQISLAGMEASGTGNMKFGMNGALTIGTLDGANVEIRDEIGADNFFLFGMTESEVASLRADGYRPIEHYNNNDELKAVIDMLDSGLLSRGDRELFRPLKNALLGNDRFMALADYPSYVDCQGEVTRVFKQPREWARRSIVSTCHMDKFSSDRAIREYSERIWKVKPVPVAPADD